MLLKNKLSWLIGLALTSMTISGVQADSIEEKLERMEAELQLLKAELKKTRKQVSATADVVEKNTQKMTKTSHSKSASSIGQRIKIGGYGELHYNNIDGKDNKIDFHRFVLFFGHDFNDKVRFFSEFELEHAVSGEGKSGEVEIEQAYLEFDLNDQHRAKTGVFLTPIGLINETHEPPTFYGVERNPLEKNIIPATWWEAGLGLSGQLGQSGLSYDVALTSGLKVDPATVNIRKGRQKASKATLNDPALTGRLKYTGIPGLELGGSLHYESDLSQDDKDAIGSATLVEAHAVLNKGSFGVKAMVARWDIDIDDAALKNKETQDGYVLEASYKFRPSVGIFARHTAWSHTEGVDAEQQKVGINWWPHEDVVLKADIQRQNTDAGDQDGFNLGIGYQF